MIQDQQQQQQQQQQQPCQHIALFGLSANPPTGANGHGNIIRQLVESNSFDEVWILPVYQHIDDTKRSSLLDYSHRLAMCQLAFETSSHRLSNTPCIVRVMDYEKIVYECFHTDTIPDTPGMIDVVHHIKMEHAVLKPNELAQELTLVLGTDTYHDLCVGKKWKGSDELLAQVKVLHIARDAIATSSTKVRNCLIVNDDLLSLQHLVENGDVYPEVLNYIMEHNVYRQNREETIVDSLLEFYPRKLFESKFMAITCCGVWVQLFIAIGKVCVLFKFTQLKIYYSVDIALVCAVNENYQPRTEDYFPHTPCDRPATRFQKTGEFLDGFQETSECPDRTHLFTSLESSFFLDPTNGYITEDGKVQFVMTVTINLDKPVDPTFMYALK